MKPALNVETIQALPKVDLHRHLEGSLRLATLWEFHCREKQTLHTSFDALRAACVIAAGERPGFLAFLNYFSALRFKFGGSEALERIAAETVADAAADGVIHLELRFSAVHAARRMKSDPGLHASQPPPAMADVETAATAVIRGARREAAACRIGVSFICSLGRNFGQDVNRPAVELLHHDIGAEFTGIDLAGDESFSARPFAWAFQMWKVAGRKLTIHAGEDPCGSGAASVSDAITEFKADRIGHGVRVIEDQETLAQVIREKIALEMCLTSNVQTRACDSFAAHPIKKLLEAGARVTLNSDDPAISVTTLSHEYFRAAQDCGLDWAQLRQCAINASESVFLPEQEKSALVKRMTEAWPQ
ncbi:MAG: adenosine deaminase [Planctomycetota bacterium]